MSRSDGALTRTGRCFVALAPLGLAVACADLFGIEGSEPAGPGVDSGESGGVDPRETGGSSAVAKGGRGATGSGGTGVSLGGDGGSRPQGGRGGAAGASGAAGDGDAGGMGGADAVPEWPREGDPCSTPDVFACPGPAANYQLKCNGMSWEFFRQCRSDQRCNRTDGTCVGILCNPVEDPSSLVSCNDTMSQARWCGPDYVSWEFEPCVFQCLEDQGCVEPEGDEHVYVDRPREILASSNPWPNHAIPVCLANPGLWMPEKIAVVRNAFYRTWGRFAGIGLTGFGPCDSGSDGVRLELAENCNVELARIPSTGYPGPGASLSVTLCTSYLDASGDSHEIEADLFEHAAVHVFGHVLGREDEAFHEVLGQPAGNVMMQIIDVDTFRVLTLDNLLIQTTLHDYGAPPRGSLKDSTSRCLGWMSSSGAPFHDACDGSPSRSFRLIDGRLAHAGTGDCLRIMTGPDGVGLGDCAGAESFQVFGAQWRVAGGDCVSAGNSYLGTGLCSPQAAADLWSFEFPAPDRVRIHLVRDGRCVRRPLDWASSVFAELGACDGVNDLFDTSHGDISVGGRCLGSNLTFSFCTGDHSERFFLSGPLESSAGALTANPGSSDDLVSLRVTPVQGTATEAQIFDFYW